MFLRCFFANGYFFACLLSFTHFCMPTQFIQSCTYTTSIEIQIDLIKYQREVSLIKNG